MNAARHTALVAQREIRERGRSKGFLISTAVVVVLAAALAALPRFVNPAATEHVGVVGAVPAGFAEALEAAAAGSPQPITTEVRAYADGAAARRAVQDGTIDVAWDPATGQLVWKANPVSALGAHVRQAAAAATLAARAAAHDVSPAQLQALLTAPPLADTSIEAPDPDRDTKTAIAMAATVVLFMAIMLAGSFVLSGVIEEKTSRVVEVVLAQVPPAQLLAGKVLGIGALALAQLVAVGAAAITAGRAAGTLTVTTVGLGATVSVLGWFVLGFGVYAVAFAAAGALANRQEDAQTLIYPVMAPLLVAYIVAIASVSEPDLPLARWLSLFPATAPVIMPLRMQYGVASPWEVVVSVTLVLAAAYGLIRIGGRVYAGAILRTGRRVRVREALEAR